MLLINSNHRVQRINADDTAADNNPVQHTRHTGDELHTKRLLENVKHHLLAGAANSFDRAGDVDAALAAVVLNRLAAADVHGGYHERTDHGASSTFASFAVY